MGSAVSIDKELRRVTYKELRMIDLCGRLPYGVKILHESWNYEWDQELSLVERVVGIDEDFIYAKVIDTHTGEEYRNDNHPNDSSFQDKLFLRPMSSMTENEKMELIERGLAYEDDGCYDGIRYGGKTFQLLDGYETIDWLNKHFFDYRGLIEKGLAIEAPEGMYSIAVFRKYDP